MTNRSKSAPLAFTPYEQLNSVPNIIVDGAAAAGTVLTLSHWPKSGTPAQLKRDTSAEIVFAYLDSPDFHVDADLVSNNHFDEDGLVGIFALTAPSLAEKYRDLLMDAANAGDFGVYRQRDAARIVFTISAYADSTTSPLPKEIFQVPYPQMAARLYEHLLELLPRLLTGVSDYKRLWETEDANLTATEALVENGEITIEERPNLDLAVIHGPENLPTTVVHRFTQTRLAELHPFALHNRTKCSRLLIVRGQHVEFQYRYESWVQLASRRPPARVDLKDLAAELNQEETSGGRWVFDGVDRITPRLHLDGSPETSLSSDTVRQRLEHHLAVGPPSWDPYD
jgi:hypothetical protein